MDCCCWYAGCFVIFIILLLPLLFLLFLFSADVKICYKCISWYSIPFNVAPLAKNSMQGASYRFFDSTLFTFFPNKCSRFFLKCFPLVFPLDVLIYAADVGIYQLFDYYFFGSCLSDFGPNQIQFYLNSRFIYVIFSFFFIEFFFFSYLNWVVRLH